MNYLLIAIYLQILNTSEGCKNVTPEDLVRCTKAITKATAKSVSAGISNKQDDIIAAANLARSSIFDMLLICKVSKFYCLHISIYLSIIAQ